MTTAADELEAQFMKALDVELERRMYPAGRWRKPAENLGPEGLMAHGELCGHVGSFRSAVRATFAALRTQSKKDRPNGR